jgi:hypothetical protein
MVLVKSANKKQSNWQIIEGDFRLLDYLTLASKSFKSHSGFIEYSKQSSFLKPKVVPENGHMAICTTLLRYS